MWLMRSFLDVEWRKQKEMAPAEQHGGCQAAAGRRAREPARRGSENTAAALQKKNRLIYFCRLPEEKTGQMLNIPIGSRRKP